MKPYQNIPIQDCGDPLLPIPLEAFAMVTPHPYVALGAPYGDRSPYFLRQGVLQRLQVAQQRLQETLPGWQIQIFDAYRPVAVQQFMVDYTFKQIAVAQQLDPQGLTPEQRQQLQAQVYQFWAPPSDNLATPPPHSTGAALDVTLADAEGIAVDMGSPIDELSPRSFPDHFAHSGEPGNQVAHHNRQRLNQIMTGAGFWRHPNEWWHFSWGDQLWAYQQRQHGVDSDAIACYGRV